LVWYGDLQPGVVGLGVLRDVVIQAASLPATEAQMDESTLVTLTSGPLKLALAPSVGGAIVGFWRDGFALLRETSPEDLAAGLVRQTSSYPLIPYSNRIGQGRFTFEEAEHQLALNFGDHPHAVHGNAWQRAWSILDAGATSCRLALDHSPAADGAKEWPFAYRAEQHFTVDSDRVALVLTLENKDERAMPAGFGLHPFFPRRPGTALQFSAAGVYRTGEASLPAENIAVPDVWDYRAVRPLGEPGLDNCFSGWDGAAEIRFEDDKVALQMRADPVFGHLVVYVPPGRPFFAVEPVSHMNDAVNRPHIADNGVRVLQPGERLTGTVTFRVLTL
jgi:aldose 1-epimerase